MTDASGVDMFVSVDCTTCETFEIFSDVFPVFVGIFIVVDVSVMFGSAELLMFPLVVSL